MGFRFLITSTTLAAAAILTACGSATRSAAVAASARGCAAGAADGAVGPAYATADLDVAAEPIGRIPTPDAPQVLLEVWQPQEARVAFVVDTLGQVERCSGRVEHATHPAWGEASLRVLPRLRFVPARKDGRAVRQQTKLRFAFTPGSG